MSKFYKVSFEQFKKDYLDCYQYGTDEQIKQIYDDIKLPERATKGSAGYDFYIPRLLVLSPGGTAKIPTGIRARIDAGWMLMIYPRSGLGFKYKVQLYNTVGVIDSDYFNAKNEGHILVKIYNDSPDETKQLFLDKGDAFVQGIFQPYGIVEDDNATAERTGGFGSTSNQQG